jgi:hypothetical protein
MRQTANQDKVIPDSFRIVLRNYLNKAEVKSLAPDGTPCNGATKGLLLRARIIAGDLVPVGKETDRRWEQGEDPSLVDFKVAEFGNASKMVVATASDRERWKNAGVRYLMRKSKFSQKTVYALIEAQPVRVQTLATFKRAVDG